MIQEHINNLSTEIARYRQSLTDDIRYDDTKDDTKQLTERQRNIIHAMETDDTITIDAMIQKTGVSAVTIKRDITALRRQGYLTRIGGRKNGRWVILKR